MSAPASRMNSACSRLHAAPGFQLLQAPGIWNPGASEKATLPKINADEGEWRSRAGLQKESPLSLPLAGIRLTHLINPHAGREGV
ncbi:MAG: hypothetical protein H6R16_2883, partial [Proteobacteria bacterium]|nr:hypothetical protein [Pseudomonadota bacterium]